MRSYNKNIQYIVLVSAAVLLASVAGVRAGFNPPGSAPPLGNVDVPVYSVGTGQTLTGDLSVTAASGIAITGVGPIGVQGGSGGTTGVYGLQSSGSNLNAIYGNASVNNYAGRFEGIVNINALLELSAGAGQGIRFIYKDTGLIWPNDVGADLFGIYVKASTNALRLVGHGGGIELTDKSLNVRLSVSEAGVVNVASGGSLQVNGVNVCLSDGTNCGGVAGNSGWTDDGAIIRLTTITNKVGIGATNPEQVLHVDGGSEVLSTGSGAGFKFRTRGQGQSGNHDFVMYADGSDVSHWWTEQTGNVINVTMGGNVGIGTTAPGHKLDVVGDVGFSGDLYAANNKSIRADSASVNTSILLGNYGDGGGFSYGTNYTASLAVEGNVKANGLCIKEDCRTSWAAIEGNLWTLNGSDLYPNLTSYNVGIGTTSPGAKLHVAGNAIINDLQVNTAVGGGPSSSFTFQSNTASGVNDSFIFNSGRAGGAYGNFEIQKTGVAKVHIGLGSLDPNTYFNIDGNVGIRTTAPGYPLHVVDNNSTAIVSADSNDATLYWSGFRIARQGSEKWFVGTDNATDNLLFRRAGTTNDVTISTAGVLAGNGSGLTSLNASNLASGTVADARLSANVSLLGAGIGFSEWDQNCANNEIPKRIGGTWQCAADSSGSGTVTGSGSTDYIAKWTGGATLGNSVLYDTGSRIGIQEPSPGYPLDIIEDNSTAIVNVNSNQGTKFWSGLRIARQSTEKWFVGVDNTSSDSLLFRRAGTTNDVTISTSGVLAVANNITVAGTISDPDTAYLTVADGLYVQNGTFYAQSSSRFRGDIANDNSSGETDFWVDDWSDFRYGLHNDGTYDSGQLYINDNAHVSGTLVVDGNTTVAGQNVCRQDGTNCPAATGSGWTDDGTMVRLTASTDSVGIGTASALTKLDVRGAISIPSGLGNAAARPTVAAARIQGEIAGIGGATPALSWDDGFLRLSAGGGTAASVKSYIDLSGYSTIPDMQQNIIFGTSGQERLRIDSSGNLTMKSTAFNVTGSALYLNTYGDAQIRIDSNNDGINQFKINNGLNATVFTVDESGNTGISVAPTSATKLNIAQISGVANAIGLKVLNSGSNFGYGTYTEKTGAGAVNIGLYASASGGTINYAAQFGSGDVYITNRLGIGTAPVATASLTVNGKISGVTAPGVGTDAANKDYVDAAVAAAGGAGTYKFTNGYYGNEVLNTVIDNPGFHVCGPGEWIGRKPTSFNNIAPTGGLWVNAPQYSSSTLNCSAWTSNAAGQSGMVTKLDANGPLGWTTTTLSCDNWRPVIICSD